MKTLALFLVAVVCAPAFSEPVKHTGKFAYIKTHLTKCYDTDTMLKEFYDFADYLRRTGRTPENCRYWGYETFGEMVAYEKATCVQESYYKVTKIVADFECADPEYKP